MIFKAQLICLSSESISFWLITDRSTEEYCRWQKLVTVEEVGESEYQTVFELRQCIKFCVPKLLTEFFGFNYLTAKFDWLSCGVFIFVNTINSVFSALRFSECILKYWWANLQAPSRFCKHCFNTYVLWKEGCHLRTEQFGSYLVCCFDRSFM